MVLWATKSRWIAAAASSECGTKIVLAIASVITTRRLMMRVKQRHILE